MVFTLNIVWVSMAKWEREKVKNNKNPVLFYRFGLWAKKLNENKSVLFSFWLILLYSVLCVLWMCSNISLFVLLSALTDLMK